MNNIRYKMKNQMFAIYQLINGYGKLKFHIKPFGLFVHNAFGYIKLI